MDLKKLKIKHFPFRWRMFAVVVVLVWAVIGVMVYYQHQNEVKYRKEVMMTELSNIDQRIINNYELGNDIPEFLRFLQKFYENSIYNELRVTVYMDSDSLVGSIGEPLPLKEIVHDISGDKKPGKATRADDLDPDRMFYYTTITSTDGNLKVCTAMPYNFSIANAFSVGKGLWGLVAFLTICATLAVLLATRLLNRNITLLRKFARRAAEGEPIEDVSKLGHDDIGDISREIVRIYEDRLRAMENSDKEHKLALHAVEEKARIKRQLTNNINHELKTPVGIIRGYLDTMANTPDMDEATRAHFLERARNNVERLCTLLNDVSTMTRLEEAGSTINTCVLNYYDVLQQVASDVDESHLAGDMKFIIDVPMDCYVWGTETLLSGMILNLVKNAVAHSHGTEIELKMVSSTPKFYIFTFSDNGVGVPPEGISHLFERFYRVDSGRSRKVGGTGLGLPIVKNTVKSLGGAISVKNRTTGGLQFTYSLRRAEVPKPDEGDAEDTDV